MKDQIKTNRGIQDLAWILLIIFCHGLFRPAFALAEILPVRPGVANYVPISVPEMETVDTGDGYTAVQLTPKGTGGPTQPEVQSFTPIGVSDLVDPFTGDFSYNIPLMDVEGYPVNIAYNSGVTMDQEASWVGLGWNLNMGAVVRSMRGLPDDFNGDLITKTETQKKRVEFGVNGAANIELFGKNLKGTDGVAGTEVQGADTVSKPTLSLGAGFTHSNYTGFGATLDFGPSFSLGKINETGISANFGLSGSSENGAGFTGGVSLSRKVKLDDMTNATMTNSFSGGMNSRAGLTQLAYGMTIKGKVEMFDKQKNALMSPLSSSYQHGLQHYSPYSSPSFLSQSLTGRFSWTTTLWGVDVQWNAGFYINTQEISNKVRTNQAFGYFNLDNGQTNDEALLDFNRDNQGTFTKYTPNLPSTFLTNDIFSVQAQGIAGSYRGYRTELGYVFDPRTESHSGGGTAGFEFGGGQAGDLGIDISLNSVNGHSGAWRNGTNEVTGLVRYFPQKGMNESNAFQEANERAVDNDPLFSSAILGTTAQQFHLEGADIRPKLTLDAGNGTISSSGRSERLKRNQLLYYLSISEVKNDMGLFHYRSDMYPDAEDHHIGEITQLGTDGRRYVFGIPAYNHKQEDATFSIGQNLSGEGTAYEPNDYSGIVTLNDFADVASTSNTKGIDESYSSQETPAYAHSFMLSAVLSDDYVDSDPVKGPSEDDLGSYVKFDYTKVDNINWRSPIGKNTAYFNPGLKTDLTDDKASFVYGEKEVWYVKAVETKNYIAIFELESRDDGVSVHDRAGQLDPSIGQMKCLKSIKLYAKPDYDVNGSSAVPIQEVHFEYDYSLCKNYPGNKIQGHGKLTLKEIYFVYQGSYKLKRSSYKFEYNSPNADYNMKAVDRWGTYSPTGTGAGDYTLPDSKLTSADFPYTVQDSSLVNEYCQQWTLTDIFLPSGGKMHVDYESDDYAYVQHLQASQMYPIVATSDVVGGMNEGDFTQPMIQPLSRNDEAEKNRSIFFKLKPGFDKREDYFIPGQAIYFKCLVNMNDADSEYDQFEYVTGYAFVDGFEVVGDYGKVTLTPVKLKDDGLAQFNPITKAAILFGRNNMQRTITSLADIDEPTQDENGVKAFLNAFADAGASYKELISGPNKMIYEQEKCQELLTQHSFIRLFEPTKHKLGGGLRVKRITMYDNWAKMVNSSDPGVANDFTYGQEFNYNLEDGTSSGVASYEPLMGGDENSWKRAMVYDEKFMFAPDNELFLAGPVMESQFPNAGVGYSRVTVADLKRVGVSRTATGKVVKEFYTARDFPTLTSRTSINKGNNSTSMKIETSFLPLLPKYDYLTVSQGFIIENNDMHGKPKSEKVYAEGQIQPLSAVNYDYQKKAIVDQGVACFKLENGVTTIEKDGSQTTSQIGVKYDAVADFEESVTNSIGAGPIEFNSNAFLAGPVFLVIPTVWAKVDLSKSQFRSATFNKTINRFGVIEKVTANQDGSIVETKNLAYDSETGDVLATQTTTNFNDKVYSLNFPAHWKYEGMGSAYQNINYEVNGYPVFADGFMPVPGAENQFVEGDEVEVTDHSTGGLERAWVTEVNSSGIRMLDKSGAPITAPSARVKIIRSGRRNKQSTGIASITSLENPITGLATEVYAKVLNAGSVELSEDWKTYCDCFGEEGLYKSTNPYVTGIKGNWRPVRSYTYLTERTQTQANNNTNIRRDGVFSAFSPYYYYDHEEWRTNPSNWTFVSKVTEFSPNGMTLETQDALGRYSSSLFSFNNTLTTAVAANSQLRQIAEGSFEDISYSNCMDQGVFSKTDPVRVSTDESHTGKSSLHVTNETVIYGPKVLECDNSVDCSVQLTATSATTYSVSGADLTIYPNIITPGTGSISLVSGVLTVTFTPGTYFEAEALIIDKNLCSVKIRINTVLPGNTQLSMQVLSTSSN